MKRAISVLAPVFLALTFAAAHADPSLATEPRPVGAFHAIDVAGTLQVEVTVGKAAHVEVAGDADLVGKITATVKDGVLVLDTPRKLRNHSHLRATVTVPALDAITISGTADMKVAGVTGDSLAISVTGTGQLDVAGTTAALSVAVAGTAQIDAGALATKDARIDVRGTGQATLRAAQSVEVKISGTGSVDVLGNPARVKKSVTGTGAVQVH
jgi:Putative auto-transporter adhesin, head GIN domain